jgi:hypothetical protein
MTEQHPITPPPELLDQWLKTPEVVTPITKMAVVTVTTNRLQMLATEAARWGADQELEACCEWLEGEDGWPMPQRLHAARRPQPPSLKEQAYNALDTYIYGNPDPKDKQNTYNTIRRALEQLPN